MSPWQIARLQAIAEKIGVGKRRKGLFHRVNISDIVQGTVKHTHVQVSAIVDKRHNERDGDVHIHVSNGEYGLVCEIIPEYPVPVPAMNAQVVIGGILRYDKEHNWAEIHPVLKIVIGTTAIP